MFGPGAYTAVKESPQVLVVSAPGSSLFGLWWLIAIPLFSLLLAFWIGHSIKANALKNAELYSHGKAVPFEATVSKFHLYFPLGGAAVALVFWCIGYTSGSIKLDRAANMATMTGKMTLFLPAQHRTVELADIADATLDQKPNARRIRLEVNHGEDLSFPIWSDRPGQQEAVDTINNFLQTGQRSR